MTWDEEREFMQNMFKTGWRYSGRVDGQFPSVAGTHEWECALAEAKGFRDYQQIAIDTR